MDASSGSSGRHFDAAMEEDASLLSLSRDVDGVITDLRKSVLDAVQSVRVRINAQCMDLIEQERKDRREHERRLLAQIENLSIVIGEKDRELVKLRTITDRFVAQAKRQRTSGATRALAKEGLRRWHQLIVQSKHRRLLGEHLTQLRREREARQVFHAWRLEAQRIKFQQGKEKLDGDHRRAVAKLTNEHHSSENRMQLELLSIKEQLQKEEEHRAILEERLKAAFMRGVCALNMEAMSVLKNTTDAGVDSVSVASLLQHLNVTAGIDTSPSAGVEPGFNERLRRQQQELQEQLNRLEIPHPDDRDAPNPHGQAPAPQRPISTRGTGRPGSHTNAMQRDAPNPVVQLNPNYPAGGSRPASVEKTHLGGTFETGKAQSRGRWRT